MRYKNHFIKTKDLIKELEIISGYPRTELLEIRRGGN
jgi:hypothetical protein